MKVVFFLRTPKELPYFEWALRELGARQHRTVLVFESLTNAPMLDRLVNDVPTVSYRRVPSYTSDGQDWRRFGKELRRFWDYLHYLGPRFRNAHVLRVRVEETIPPFLVRFAWLWRLAGRRGINVLVRVLNALEAAIPVDTLLLQFLEQEQPDVVLIAPLVDVGSSQVDYVKASRELGIRSVVAIPSWDNLTNKGLIRVVPDRVFVWNTAQQAEAVELHKVPPARVVTTGAHLFDHWFNWSPSSTKQELIEGAGLRGDQPFVLYLGSTASIASGEGQFVRRWLTAVRESSDPGIANIGVIIRPHPKRVDYWKTVDLSAFGNVALSLSRGVQDTESRRIYFDSMYHSAAVVGINTSALLEAAITRRPILTVLGSEVADGQNGTLHFAHLLSTFGGLVHVAQDFNEHLVQLRAAVFQPDGDKSQRFVESFIRPRGADIPASSYFADEVEAVSQLGSYQPPASSLWSSLLRQLIGPLLPAHRNVRSQV